MASGKYVHMMLPTVLFFLSVIVSAIGERQKPPAFCKRGFRVAGLYHECWEQATEARPFEELFDTEGVYDAAFLERYASHMCSEVKPLALRCLRKKVRSCNNSQKLFTIADGSGGACIKNKLNPFFRLQIIDKLKSVPRKSKCFDVSEKSYSCYEEAGSKIMKVGVEAEDIPNFHKVADRFFDHLWQCMIDIFKSNADVCPNWQIPMLLTLQRTAMPSLFGMRLNNYQIEKLELGTQRSIGHTGGHTASDEDCGDIGCPKSKSSDKVYLLIKVLSEKPKTQEGGVLLEVASLSSLYPALDVVKGGESNVDVRDFVDELVAGNKKMTLQEIRQLRNKQRENSKEIAGFLDIISPSRMLQGGRLWGRTTDENGMVNHPQTIKRKF